MLADVNATDISPAHKYDEEAAPKRTEFFLKVAFVARDESARAQLAALLETDNSCSAGIFPQLTYLTYLT